MIDGVSVHPAPSVPEAIAIAAAVGSLIDEEAGAAIDPTPAAYRSAWRAASLAEGVLRHPENGRSE